MSRVELLPCPWCGAVPDESWLLGDHAPLPDGWLRHPMMGADGACHLARHTTTIGIWNARVPDPAAHAALEAENAVLRLRLADAWEAGRDAAAELDLLDFVNEAMHAREEARDREAAYRVGVPVACAAVELYRAAIRALTPPEVDDAE